VWRSSLSFGINKWFQDYCTHLRYGARAINNAGNYCSLGSSCRHVRHVGLPHACVRSEEHTRTLIWEHSTTQRFHFRAFHRESPKMVTSSVIARLLRTTSRYQSIPSCGSMRTATTRSDAGEMKDLGTLPGDTNAYAYDINATRYVVGTSQVHDGRSKHFCKPCFRLA
jgi:uncharacterized membrane protein